MQTIDLIYEPFPSGDLARFLEDNVLNHGFAQTGISEWFPVGFFLRNGRGEYLGGCTGHIWGGWMQIRYLWVSESLRRRGYGSRLMDAAEDFAAEHGSHGVTLETHSYQAKDFYLKRGFEVFATLDGYPVGHAKHYLRKRLA